MAKILIVDNDPNIRIGICKFLEHYSHEIKTAKNGREALSLIKHGNFNLILSDKSMPQMNGPTLIKRVNQDFPKIGTILMSGDKILSKDPGDYHLHKPFGFETLLSAIARVLSRKRIVST